MGFLVRFDSKGKPYEYPTCRLDAREYAKIIHEINSNYELYKDKPYPVHYSVGIDNHYYAYFFENHGFNDYNIVEKFEI